MGKRRFNEKGRQKVDTVIDNTATKQIKLEIDNLADEYDDANLLVLPSKKRPTKIKRDATVVTKILSKKQRKRLENIVDQKKKKDKRSFLIAALASVQAPSDELGSYTKISSVQTKGLKQHFREQKFGVIERKAERVAKGGVEKKQTVKSLVGGRKQRLSLLRAQAIPASDEEKAETAVDSEESSSSEDEISDGKPEEGNNTSCEPKQKTEEQAVVSEEVEPAADVSQRSVQEKTTVMKATPLERIPASYVHVERDPAIQAARLKLPILGEEQEIMEKISENSVVILAGETGSGKTTQVPQFLYEAGYATKERGLIAITEPRRVAAIAMSKRVGTEMNLSSKQVSYLIRFEGNVTDQTRIKFVTDGVLLKEIEHDFLLSAYSVVIIDEAHERSVYTDILIGLLSRIVTLRNKKDNPLKLIIMSATMRVKDFTENRNLFSEVPPIINVESRQFPVTVHFSKTTPSDYLREAYSKVVKVHTKLPEGAILVFLTGQKEVNYVVKKLRRAFPFREKYSAAVISRKSSNDESDSENKEEHLECIVNPRKAAKLNKKKKKIKRLAEQKTLELPKINLDNYQLPWDDTQSDQCEEGDNAVDDEDSEGHISESDMEDDVLADYSEMSSKQPLWVLPLYSILSSEKQQKVFEPPPEGTRLCVVATNVAETSLTIPDVKYVVDCGRQKTKLYDKVTGVTAFVVTFISKASANQRAGRAGRVAPGHCYRLYSSAVYNDQFADFAVPEIQKKPVDDLILHMKCMGIDKVVNFPFPSPPDRLQLQRAEQRLILMEALEECIVNGKNKSQTISKITELGRTIAAFPVAPRFGKMLALSHQYGLLPYTICMVAALSVQEVLEEVSLSEESPGNKKWRMKRKTWAGTGNSLLLGDPMILLRAVGAAEFANSEGRLASFCKENGIRLKAIIEIRKLRIQLTNEINMNLKDLNLIVDPKLPPPSDTQCKLLRQLILIGMADQIARKIPESEIKLKTDKIKSKHAYNLTDLDQPVFVHSSSVLHKTNPEWICYQEAYEISNGESTKMFLRGVTAIESEWLVQFVPKHCNIIKVLEAPQPRYDAAKDRILCHVCATIGKTGWPLPMAEVDMPKDMMRCRYFAMFLLTGEVFGDLRRFSKHLLSSSDSMIKSYSAAIPRVNGLLKTLQQNGVFVRARLEQLWKADKNFLRDEYLKFLPVSCQEDVKKMWPPTK